VRLLVDFLADSAILFEVRDITDNQFRKIAETRMAQMREWKALQLDMTTAESDRPTWEQFKRGLKVKKVTKKG
jgi:hypothetical protein